MKIDDRAFPLYWPEGVKRTPPGRRARARFKTMLGAARENLLGELERLGAANKVISTNLPLRPDGLFRIDDRRLEDPGVAVYFIHVGKPRAMACDRWDTLAANIHALALTIEALRGIERWGSSDLVERAFTGFTALPPAAPPPEHWMTVLGFHPSSQVGMASVRARFRELALERHPDRGGSDLAMARLNEAMEAAERELGAAGVR
jgi:hypothetical protein